MDPLTHGIAGSLAARSFADKKDLRPAAAAGFVSALLADLDYFIHNPSDPLLTIEIHRQFTHSLIFIPAGALIASGLLWFFIRKHLPFRRLYLYCLVSYATAGIMDSFTSYGTTLLWPFSDTRFAFNLISILDPLFTAILLSLLAASLYTKKRPWLILAWIWIAGYLTFGYLQRESAASAAMELAAGRGHMAERLIVKPTMGNLLLWRAVYETNERFFVDAIRVTPVGETRIYPGESVPRVYPEESYDSWMASILYFDIMRFSRLSDDYLIRHPEKPDILGDVRYSMIPNSTVPLWGIEADTSRADEHVPFLYFRNAGREVRLRYIDMVLGRDLSGP